MREQIRQFMSWLVTPVPDYLSDLPAYSLTDIADLRARDLQKILQRLGKMTTAEVSKILDKTELQHRVLEAMTADRVAASNRIWTEKAQKYSSLVLVLTLLYLAKNPILYLSATFSSYFEGMFYFQRLQLGNVRVALKKHEKAAAIFLVLALILDLVQRWMEVSTMLSWVIPSSSPARMLLFPFNLSLPVSTDMLVPEGSSNKPQGSQDGLSINLAPMLYISVTRWTKAWLQERGAAGIVKYVLDKGKRRATRHQKDLPERQESENPTTSEQGREAVLSSSAVSEGYFDRVGDDNEEEELAKAIRQEFARQTRVAGARAVFAAAQSKEPGSAPSEAARFVAQERYKESRGVQQDDLSFLNEDQSGNTREGTDDGSGEPFKWVDDERDSASEIVD